MSSQVLHKIVQLSVHYIACKCKHTALNHKNSMLCNWRAVFVVIESKSDRVDTVNQAKVQIKTFLSLALSSKSTH